MNGSLVSKILLLRGKKIARRTCPKFLLLFIRFSILIVIIISIREVFCAYDVIFSNSQPSLGTRSSNGGRKFSEIKVKKE